MSNLKIEAYNATENLPGTRVIENTTEAVVDKIARDIMYFALQCVGERGAFHIALSGGSTPKALFKHWIMDLDFRVFPWEKTHIWIVDDRVVPEDDDRSNLKMMTNLLFSQIPTPQEQIHPMRVMDDNADLTYETELKAALETNDGVLDYVILGMGPDGHTASLFPQTPGLDVTDRLIIYNDGERVIQPRPRMTMTYPVINSARKISTLLTGAGKFEMLSTIQQPDADPHEYPILGIIPSSDNEQFWYLDLPAALGREISSEELEEDDRIEI